MSDIKMSFNKDVAKDVGTDAAIILSNIQYWCKKNEANDKHFHDGRYWTYNSVRAFNKLFYYLTPRQISHCLDKLKKKGYIITGNYNDVAYDRTIWYSCKMHSTNLLNGINKNVKPIPNEKPNSKTHIKKTKGKKDEDTSKEEANQTTKKTDLQSRQQQFKKEVAEFSTIYPKQMLIDFYGYWSEPTQTSSPKMKKELQKTWDTKRRLVTWAKRGNIKPLNNKKSENVAPNGMKYL